MEAELITCDEMIECFDIDAVWIDLGGSPWAGPTAIALDRACYATDGLGAYEIPHDIASVWWALDSDAREDVEDAIRRR